MSAASGEAGSAGELRLRGEYVLTELGDESVACSVGEGECRAVVLNESGRLLWRLLEKGCTEAELSAALCAEFEVAAETACADVRGFVAVLQCRGVL